MSGPFQLGYTVWLSTVLDDRSGTAADGDVGTARLVVYRGKDRASGVGMIVPEASLTKKGTGAWEFGWVPTAAGTFLVEWDDTLGSMPRGKRDAVTVVEV